jgi:hypothetical protein
MPPHPSRLVLIVSAALIGWLERPPAMAPLRPTDPANPAPSVRGIVLSRPVLESMDAVFARFNAHWDDLQGQNTLTQMLGTGKPTQREYLGCLQGHIVNDTLILQGWVPALNMKQLQFAVTGDCAGVPNRLGTWHTHPYRADPRNLPLKEPHLSRQDLDTFAASDDVVSLVVWDSDSMDAAVKDLGTVRHPAPVTIR